MPKQDVKNWAEGNIVELSEIKNPWARISEIAARVGVKPITDGGQHSIVAEGADGNMYDVWDVISGFLDKIDGATSHWQSSDLKAGDQVSYKGDIYTLRDPKSDE